MEVRLSEKAIRNGVLRIWLRRIPEEGGVLLAYASENSQVDQPIGTATLYGRGPGSEAQERSMLYFRLMQDLPNGTLTVGELIDIRLEGQGDDDLSQIELDIVAVE